MSCAGALAVSFRECKWFSFLQQSVEFQLSNHSAKPPENPQTCRSNFQTSTAKSKLYTKIHLFSEGSFPKRSRLFIVWTKHHSFEVKNVSFTEGGFFPRWAMKKKPWLVVWYRGIFFLPEKNGDDFISQYSRIPINQSVEWDCHNGNTHNEKTLVGCLVGWLIRIPINQVMVTIIFQPSFCWWLNMLLDQGWGSNRLGGDSSTVQHELRFRVFFCYTSKGG